jgi:hypothetical protein
MADVGRPTELTEELTLKIREGVLDEKEYKVIMEELGISPGTWDYWVYKDYQGFRALLSQWKHERMVKKAKNKVEQLIHAEDEKVALNASTFILETLDKKNHSKRSELTGAEGKELPTPILHVPINNSNNQGSEAV